ncbi:MAG: sterol desaturase family protein [Mucilaginibacter sp.]|nr:sterol desaturase family protein [Mucilaginibacter sp.]
MISSKKLNKNIAIIENVIFVAVFAFTIYKLLSTYGLYTYQSIKGKGYLGAIVDPLYTHQYYVSAVSVIIILNATFLLWEILSFIVKLLKEEKAISSRGYLKFKSIFKQVAVHYKSSFLALLIHELLPKLIIIQLLWILLPHFQKLQLFTVDLSWYSWIYGYLLWELSSWLFHFSSHRVRFLWCLHSPHHAPTELNMTVNWIHFFAESYYSTLVFLVIFMLFGINPTMVITIVSIDSAWGIFIHVSERTLRDGRLGVLRHLIITPSHHRVHHAKNPLYLDTNFANVLPIWDWVMGTLQPIREEVKTEYGISRELDVTNFSDLYFGELLLLFRDVKNAAGLKNKVLYILMPPGWHPESKANTAAVLRQQFLQLNPSLGITSKQKFFITLRSRFRRYKLEAEAVDMPEQGIIEVK